MDLVIVMNGPDTVDPATDTSFALIVAAGERGHRTWHCDASDVEWFDGSVTARVRSAEPDPDATPCLRLGEERRLDLSAVDAVLVRTDPPFDAAYLHLTLLLDLVTDRTLVVNAPRGLRDANEKLYACRFSGVMPPTIVTSDAATLLAFAREQGAAVLKPIGGHGGRGVLALRPADDNAPSIVDTLTDRGRTVVMAQQFLENVAAGDKRILLLDGEPLGGVLRVPTDVDFRANICVGGSTVASEIEPSDQRIIDAIAPALRADGLYFVGLDVIDGHLTEVNVTSPTGITQIAALSGTRPDLDVIRWIERRVGTATT